MILDLLKLREFRAFLLANTAERLAASGMTVLLGFQIYELHHNPLDLGMLGLVEALPGVSLVLYGGHVADQHSRRRIVLITTALLTLFAATLSLKTAFGTDGLTTLLYVIAFLSACVRAFETPAATGLEAQVLPIEKVMRGVPILASAARTADVVGPVVAGFLWAWLGPSGTYGVLAALFATTCVTLLTQVSEKPPTYRDNDKTSVAKRIAEGITFVFRSPVLWGSMALDLFAVFFGGATALLPIFATDILHVGSEGFGILRAASAAGALGAAVLATRFLPKKKAGAALHLVIAGFGVSIIVFGLSRNFYLSLVALFAAGICDGLSMVIRHAIMRLASPDALRGRIAAVRMVFVGSSNELGALESGLAAAAFGAAAAVWLGGIVTIAVVGAVWAVAGPLRQLNLISLSDAQKDLPRGQPAPIPASASPSGAAAAEAAPG